MSERRVRPPLSRTARVALLALRAYVLATVPLALYALFKALY